jgi:hypothetical protein
MLVRKQERKKKKETDLSSRKSSRTDFYLRSNYKLRKEEKDEREKKRAANNSCSLLFLFTTKHNVQLKRWQGQEILRLSLFLTRKLQEQQKKKNGNLLHRAKILSLLVIYIQSSIMIRQHPLISMTSSI